MPLVPADLPVLHVARAAASRQGLPRTDHRSANGIPPLHGAIPARRAVRRFTPNPVDLDEVEHVLDLARAVYGTHWPVSMRVLVALPAGEDPRLLENRHVLGRPPWLSGLRDTYVAAPVLLLICGNATSLVPGHAAAHFHAGALGLALWLAATSADLAGCAFGGTCAEVTTAAQDLDPSLRHLFTVAVGYPGE